MSLYTFDEKTRKNAKQRPILYKKVGMKVYLNDTRFFDQVGHQTTNVS